MLTVIMGAPCSGKSTYVREHAKRGDIVIDFDRIAAALSHEDSPAFVYTEQIVQLTMTVRRRAIDQAVAWHHAYGAQVWVIDTQPSKARRAEYHRMGAEFVTMDPGITECLSRARLCRPPRSLKVIQDWYLNRAG